MGRDGRVAKRADQVEDRPERELASDGRDRPGPGEIAGANRKAILARPGTVRQGGLEVGRHAQSGEDVRAAGATGGRAVAVLDDRHAAGRHDDRRRRRDLTVSHRRPRSRRCRAGNRGASGFPSAIMRSRTAATAPLELVGRLPFHPQGRQECGRDGLGRLAVEHCPKRRVTFQRWKGCCRQEPLEGRGRWFITAPGPYAVPSRR